MVNPRPVAKEEVEAAKKVSERFKAIASFTLYVYNNGSARF